MIRIAITQAAFDAIASTLPPPLGSVENATNERGERLVWLTRRRSTTCGPCAAPARAILMSFSRSPPPTAIGPRRSRAGGLPALVAITPPARPSLAALRGEGESYSDVILKLAAESVV